VTARRARRRAEAERQPGAYLLDDVDWHPDDGLPPSAAIAPPTRGPDCDVHSEPCHSTGCPCYRAGADLAAQFVATLRDDSAGPAPTDGSHDMPGPDTTEGGW
jgi:hypothetical protein